MLDVDVVIFYIHWLDDYLRIDQPIVGAKYRIQAITSDDQKRFFSIRY
jgi:hypothetical protein